jgi:hypothetical protein
MQDDQTVFWQSWQSKFGNSPPLGHILREALSMNWTRFYALPNGKRYASDIVEKNEILFRANTLMSEISDAGDQIWLVIDSFYRRRSRQENLLVRFDMRLVWTWFYEEEDLRVTFHAAEVVWQPHEWDFVFSSIAEDQERAVFYNATKSAVLAPYDGGFDLFAANPDKILELENKFGAWMSDRPDKL